MTKRRIYLYDSTLRDGAQTSGVDFSAADKYAIALKLDELGMDYIEGGWPGANPTDDAFFNHPPAFSHAKLCAFGMTRRPSTSASNDPGLSALINSGAAGICLVGKTWDFHVTEALSIRLDENIAMISDSIAHVVSQKREALFDAEHFFDGFKANKAYALSAICAAYEAGSRWIVLCDTNGGTLPHEIFAIVTEVTRLIPGEHLGIHCHNDTEHAVANSVAAVMAGVCQVQGTLNGVGERCGNANLVSIIPTLKLKLGLDVGISDETLRHLTKISHFFDDKLNKTRNIFAPYVGASAFAHKGGLHVSAVLKNPACYEHINPDLIGNERKILVSDQAGRSNILSRLHDIGIDPAMHKADTITSLIETIKERESRGYAYDSADASFEILAHQSLRDIPTYFRCETFKIVDERSWNSQGEIVVLSEATAHIRVGEALIKTSAKGNGPVHALDLAIRKALITFYPILEQVSLIDYKVRSINSSHGTDAITRVLIESENEQGQRWVTMGVSPNIIDASYNALRDSLVYALMKQTTTRA